MSARERRAKARKRGNAGLRRASVPVAILSTAALGLAGPATSAQASPLSVSEIANLNTDPLGSNPEQLTAVGGQTYFTADSPSSGYELYTTNGQSAGTSLVDDIVPGPGSSYPTDLTNAGGRLFFFAENAAGAEQLYTSNGTAASTTDLFSPQIGQRQLANIASTVYFLTENPHSGNSYLGTSNGTVAGTTESPLSVDGPADLTAAGTELYFLADGDTSATEDYEQVWATTGSGPAQRVSDFTAESDISNLTNVDGKLYFTANASTGEQIWTASPTTAAVVTRLTNASYITDLTGDGSDLYFAAANDTAVTDLWVTDGLAAGTTDLTQLSSYYGSQPDLTNVAGAMYFLTQEGELSLTNGTAAGTEGLGTQDASELTNADGKLYFAVAEGTDGIDTSNGTAAGTVEATSAAGDALIAELINSGANLYFSAADGPGGQRLWTSDGTTAGTETVDANINAGDNQGSYPGEFTSNGTDMLFTANVADERGLYVSNGAGGGTTQLDPAADFGFIRGLTNVNGVVDFVAEDASGEMLWGSNGTSAGTAPLGVTTGAYPFDLANINGELYFVADGATDATDNALQLWSTNGAQAGTTQLTSFTTPVEEFQPTFGGSGVVNVGSEVYFAASGPGGAELWESNGTAAGTAALSDSDEPSEANISYIYDLAAVGGEVYFSGDQEDSADELFASNGTGAGTTAVGPISTSDPDVTNVAGVAYFSSDGGLWTTDGVAAGTTEVAADVDPSELTNDGGELYFSGSNSLANGTGLWKSNGAAAGTSLVDAVDPTATYYESGYLGDLSNSNGLLTFAANDGTHGTELWSSDGTTAGTSLANDIFPGAGSGLDADLGLVGDSYLSGPDISNIGSTLFFAADDGPDGVEPWSSGTVAAPVPTPTTPTPTPTTPTPTPTTPTPTPTTPTPTPTAPTTSPPSPTTTTPTTTTPTSTTLNKVTVGKISTLGDSVSIVLTCAKGTAKCTVHGTLEIVETFKGKQLVAISAVDSAKKPKPKTKQKTLTLSTKKVTLDPGHALTLKLTLDGTGKTLLASHKKLKVELLVTESTKTLVKRTVNMKAPVIKKPTKKKTRK